MAPLPFPSIAAFAALTLALIALWAPGASSRRMPVWSLAGALAIVAALAGPLLDPRGLIALLACAVSCGIAANAGTRSVRGAAAVTMLALCAGLFLHILPGFDNPRLVTDVVLGTGAAPYTKYLNFDKGAAGLFILGLYAIVRGPADDEGWRHRAGMLWRTTLLIAVVIVLSLAAGFVRWDPKLPAWWAAWLWSTVFLTALPEEALFRGVLQASIERWLGNRPFAGVIAIVTAGVLFGIAHAAGGPTYVMLAAVAGIGYGWIYSSTRSIAGAILAHAALDAVHFLLFTYPALRT